MVIVVGLLLIAALVLDSVITYLNELAVGYPRLIVWLGLADRSLSFLLMPVVFAMLFWFLPSTKIQWRDIWPAAVVTACLVAASRYLIGFYLKFSTTSEIYAASSTLVVLLIWVYMTGLVVFFGASLSYAWAQIYGSRSEFADKKADQSEALESEKEQPDTDSAKPLGGQPPSEPPPTPIVDSFDNSIPATRRKKPNQQAPLTPQRRV